MTVSQEYDPKANLDRLREHPQNPRRGNTAAVSASVDANGFYGAIVAQKSSRFILAGHTRARALAASGVSQAPVLWVDCDDETATRILLADNRTAELAAWDDADLYSLLGGIDPDDLAGAGFDVEDFAALGRKLDAASFDGLDAAAEWERAGMPEYVSDGRTGAYQTFVTFPNAAAADEFFQLIGRPKAKRFWWPSTDGFVGYQGKAIVTAEVDE